MTKSALILVCLLCSAAAWGAARNNPPWADPVLPPPSNKTVSPEMLHNFLDRHNRVNLAVLGGVVAADGITTQQNLANHAEEMNPIARPLVERGWAGQLGASVLGYGGSIAAAYMLHRAGHHKLEHLVFHVAIGAEAAMVTNNLLRAKLH